MLMNLSKHKLNTRHKMPDDRYYEIENQDFREYRKKFNRGGDFIVYSDVQRQSVSYSLDI